jgi:hypothetical protein
MAGGAPEGWRSDPYRRHELRYWDGLAWTAHVSDLDVVGDDPVFPVLDSAARTYLTPVGSRARGRRSPRLPGLDRAAAWAVSGFLGVIALATFAAVDGSAPPPRTPPQVAGVEAAAAQVPATEDHDADAAGRTPASAATTRAAARRALALLSTLPVQATTARTGAPDGSADTAADGAAPPASGSAAKGQTGCDVLQEVLRRDLTHVRLAPDGCTVLSGVLRDPSSGATVRYRRGAANPAVRVDHALPTAAARRTGAADLGTEQQRALTNDPLNLVALSTATSRARGSASADVWLPRNRSARCRYVARQIAVKAAYGLWVTRTERNAMRTVLATCPEEPVPSR